LIGAALGGSAGYFAERLPFVTGLLALSAATPLGSGQGNILAAPGAAPPDLKTVQSKLNALGMASPLLKADGIMGQKTAAAIEKFQKSKGLMATGVLDVSTIKALGL
jgi:peptidoglycan hydrolase-like protein with peptidoglycan-binding domain